MTAAVESGADCRPRGRHEINGHHQEESHERRVPPVRSDDASSVFSMLHGCRCLP